MRKFYTSLRTTQRYEKWITPRNFANALGFAGKWSEVIQNALAALTGHPALDLDAAVAARIADIRRTCKI